MPTFPKKARCMADGGRPGFLGALAKGVKQKLGLDKPAPPPPPPKQGEEQDGGLLGRAVSGISTHRKARGEVAGYACGGKVGKH